MCTIFMLAWQIGITMYLPGVQSFDHVKRNLQVIDAEEQASTWVLGHGMESIH